MKTERARRTAVHVLGRLDAVWYRLHQRVLGWLDPAAADLLYDDAVMDALLDSLRLELPPISHEQVTQGLERLAEQAALANREGHRPPT
jgi:hypothetical protein